MLQNNLKALILFGIVLLTGDSAQAQHPVDVQRKAAEGDYMAALITFERMPKRIATATSRVAAARSAWALGLSSLALEQFDQALIQGGLNDQQVARIHFSKAVIEHQEGHPQLAIMNAEKALTLLNSPSPLRAQVFALWGEALAKQGAFAPAEEKYIKALEEADGDLLPELSFLLGSIQFELGKYDDARSNLEKIPLRHDRASEGLMMLARVSVVQGQFGTAGFWLSKGREEFPDYFLDSWVDYVLVRSAVEAGDLQQVRALRAQAEKRYPPSDPWVALIAAVSEQFEWTGSSGGKQ